MTSYGFCFRPALDRNDCSGPLLLWIDHRGKTTFLSTPYDIRHEEWDPISGSIRNTTRRRQLAKYARSMARDLSIIESTLRNK